MSGVSVRFPPARLSVVFLLGFAWLVLLLCVCLVALDWVPDLAAEDFRDN